MLRFSLATLLLSSVALANEPPPETEGGLVVIAKNITCFDMETGEKGLCHILRDVQGGYYTAFWQGETLQFIRRPLPGGGYETIWVNDMYNSY